MPSLSALLREPHYRALRASWGTITLYPTRFELHQARLYLDKKEGRQPAYVASPSHRMGRTNPLPGKKLSPEEEFDHSSDMVSLLIFLGSKGLGPLPRAPLLNREQIDVLVGDQGDLSWRSHVPVALSISAIGNHVWGAEKDREEKSSFDDAGRGNQPRHLRQRTACHRLLKGFNLSDRRKRGDREGVQTVSLPDPKVLATNLTPDRWKSGEKLLLWLAKGDAAAVALESLDPPYLGLGFRRALEEIGRDIGYALTRMRFGQKFNPERTGRTGFKRSTCIIKQEWLERAARAEDPWAKKALGKLLAARQEAPGKEVVICLQIQRDATSIGLVSKAEADLKFVFGCRQRLVERRTPKSEASTKVPAERFSEFRKDTDPLSVLDTHDWSAKGW